MSMKCPLCNSSTHVKSSRYLSDHIKERYCQCTNLKCSATFRTAEQFVHMLSSPATQQSTDEENEAAWLKVTQKKKSRAA